MKISQSISKLLTEMIFTLKFTKGYNSIKNIGGVTELDFSKLSDHVLYLYQISLK